MCWIVARRFANFIIPILCAALFGFQLSKPAEEIGCHLAGESRAQPIGFLVGLLGIAVGFMLFAQIARRDQ
jgi:hypothetical protein